MKTAALWAAIQKGAGAVASVLYPLCQTCAGTGLVPDPDAHDEEGCYYTALEPCAACLGTGRTVPHEPDR